MSYADDPHEAWNEGVAQGAAETRASIVAWMRSRAAVLDACGYVAEQVSWTICADAIERGEDLAVKP